MSRVDAVNTRSTASDVFRALLDAGAPPDAVTMLAAQSAEETGGWRYMWNWNVGNITHGGDSFDWTILPGNALHFRSYPDLAAGAADFVSFLTQRGLIPFAATNDLDGYVAQLQRVNYVGSNPNVYPPYKAAMAAWMRRLGGVVPTSPSGHPVIVAAAVLLLAGAVAYGIHENVFDGIVRRALRHS
jgi:hypothetical protein